MSSTTFSEKSQSLAGKLLARAMDCAAHEGEALSAAEKFVAVIPAAPAAAPPSLNIRVRFGKYRDMTLGEIAEEDIGYVAWLAANHSQPWIRDAAVIVLDFYGGMHQ